MTCDITISIRKNERQNYETPFKVEPKHRRKFKHEHRVRASAKTKQKKFQKIHVFRLCTLQKFTSKCLTRSTCATVWKEQA